MFFQRLAAKAELINHVVAQTYGLPESLNGPVSESLVGVCEVLYCLSFFASCIRFIDVVPDERPYQHTFNSLQAFRRDTPAMRR